MLDDDPRQPLAVGDRERVGDRREVGEALAGELRGLVASEEHRDGDLAVSRAKDRGDPVTGLDAEAERAQEIAPALRERYAGPATGALPVGALACSGPQLVRREEALVAQPGQVRIERGQDVAQGAERRVAVGLLQRLAADSLDLAAVEPEVRRRIVAGGATQRRAVAVEHDEQERGRAAGVARLPRRAEGRRVERCRARGDEQLQRRGTLADGQADGGEGCTRRQRHRAQRMPVEKARLRAGIVCATARCVLAGHLSSSRSVVPYHRHANVSEPLPSRVTWCAHGAG